MSGAGFFARTWSPQAITLNMSRPRAPSVVCSSASMFIAVVVLAIASLQPALSASSNKRSTPSRKGTAPSPTTEL